ncbi:MAG: hypothetical protein GEV06_21175 [Luteitalea sp.]|nr:hypothetical protein [Luteitalea sp.]
MSAPQELLPAKTVCIWLAHNSRGAQSRSRSLEAVACRPARRRTGTFVNPILTSDQAVLERVLREKLWPGGATPLWGAVGAAVKSLQGEPGRRVVLILTDGAAAGELPGYPLNIGHVRQRVIEGSFMLYAIGVRGSTLTSPVDPDLAMLVDDSGGARFELSDDPDLEATFSRVADELRRQYLIGFRPDDKVRGT